MSLKCEEITIDGYRFITTQFTAMRSFTLLGKLAKTIGPALGVLTNANPDANIASLAPQLATAMMGMDPEEATKLAAQVLGSTMAITPAGVKHEFSDSTQIDQVFNGRLGRMFKVLGFVLRVNYGDFLGGSGDAVAPQSPAAQ